MRGQGPSRLLQRVVKVTLDHEQQQVAGRSLKGDRRGNSQHHAPHCTVLTPLLKQNEMYNTGNSLTCEACSVVHRGKGVSFFGTLVILFHLVMSTCVTNTKRNPSCHEHWVHENI